MLSESGEISFNSRATVITHRLRLSLQVAYDSKSGEAAGAWSAEESNSNTPTTQNAG